MNLDDLYRLGLLIMAGWTILTVAVLLRVVAPYGRHARGGWGPTMPARWGWMLFESPAVVLLTAVFLMGPNAGAPGPTALVALWLLHYVHRDLVWPFRMTSGHKPMPLAVVATAFAFQVVNSGLVALWLGTLGDYPAGWLSDPRFLIGAALFLAGFAINVHADHVLFTLRAPGRFSQRMARFASAIAGKPRRIGRAPAVSAAPSGRLRRPAGPAPTSGTRPAVAVETGYKIPRGGLYRWVSCPNYLGELLEWTGFALASWCLPGLAFAVYTAANLVPRAVAHHRWYRERFPDYPAGRRALIPGLL